MSESILIGLAAIIVLGTLAQWLAWRLHLPAILLLLVFGVIAGPVFGILDPDAIFGDLLFPLVSVSVAIILFEGGLSLRLSEARQVGTVVTSLTTIGIIITWVLSAALAYWLLDISFSLSVLLGAILVVSGPTVIIPLLRQVRPVGNVGSIVKWEGIVNDPVGAILAVLVFEAILSGGLEHGTGHVVLGVFKAAFIGAASGVAAAGVIVLLLKRYLIPDFLQNPVALMVVVLCYAGSDALQPESGLLAVTVMGFALVNQPFVSIRHILDFKENLRVLLISSLFIILAARLPVVEVMLGSPIGWVFVLSLIVIVRPAMALISTWGSGLKLNERLFVGWMAPRGIVAAAVASVFAIRLSEAGVEGADILIPITFEVIVGTVAIYGLTAPYVARLLKVAQPDPQGILFAGANRIARSLATHLHQLGFRVALVDTNWGTIANCRKEGMNAYYGNVLSEEMLAELQLDGIGSIFAMTANDEVNYLALLHFSDLFDSSHRYQLTPRGEGRKARQTSLPRHLKGRYLFDEKATYDNLLARLESGAVVKSSPITEEFSFEDFRSRYGDSALPLFLVTDTGELRVFTTDSRPTPRAGQTMISLVTPADRA